MELPPTSTLQRQRLELTNMYHYYHFATGETKKRKQTLTSSITLTVAASLQLVSKPCTEHSFIYLLIYVVYLHET